MRYITLAFTEQPVTSSTSCPVMASLLYNHTLQSFFILHFPQFGQLPNRKCTPKRGQYDFSPAHSIPSTKKRWKNTSCQFSKATSPAITWYLVWPESAATRNDSFASASLWKAFWSKFTGMPWQLQSFPISVSQWPTIQMCFNTRHLATWDVAPTHHSN